MKKELKRYMLVEYAGSIERVLNSKEEYTGLIESINKHNNRKNKKYIFGNISCKVIDDKYYVIVHRYHKLTDKMGITDLDNMTSNMSEEELIRVYSDKVITKINEGFVPDINIAYLEDKNTKDKTDTDLDRGIRYIPVLYKGDVMYLNKEYIFKCMAYYLRMENYGFFLDLCNEFEANRDVSEEIENLRVAIDKVRFQGVDEIVIYYAARALYEALIVERDKTTRVVRNQDGSIQISRRRQRDFGFFIRDYGMKSSKRSVPTKYNKKYPEFVSTMSDEIEYDEDDRLQEEYSLIAWDQDNGIVHEDYEVEYDTFQKKYVRK